MSTKRSLSRSACSRRSLSALSSCTLNSLGPALPDPPAFSSSLPFRFSFRLSLPFPDLLLLLLRFFLLFSFSPPFPDDVLLRLRLPLFLRRLWDGLADRLRLRLRRLRLRCLRPLLPSLSLSLSEEEEEEEEELSSLLEELLLLLLLLLSEEEEEEELELSEEEELLVPGLHLGCVAGSNPGKALACTAAADMCWLLLGREAACPAGGSMAGCAADVAAAAAWPWGPSPLAYHGCNVMGDGQETPGCTCGCKGCRARTITTHYDCLRKGKQHRALLHPLKL